MSGAGITMENVSWRYAGANDWALRNINLAIHEGEFVAVMGESGSGKTTFCKLFNGIIPHSEPGRLVGTVTIDGVETSAVSVAALAAKVGMALDDPDAQLFTSTVRDEAAFGPENLCMPLPAIEERVNRALETAGLASLATSPPETLSGGQRQRLAIAAALAMANRALVLDEPVSRLDPAGAREVLSLIRNIRADLRLMVIMTTHSGEDACEFADMVCVLKNGTMAAYDAPRAIFSNAALLRECGIRPPAVSALAHHLRERGAPLPRFPVCHDEAKTAVLDWYGRT